MLFPEAVRFQATFSRPIGALEAVSLRLVQSDQLDLTFDFAPEDVVLFSEPQAVLVYLWEFSDVAMPRLFEPIEYAWTVTAIDGSTARFASTVIIQDPRAEWGRAQDDSGRLTVFSPVGTRILLEELTPPLDRMTDEGLFVEPSGWLLYIDPLSPECSVDDNEQPFTESPLSVVRLPCDAGSFEALADASDLEILNVMSFAGARDQILRELVLNAYREAWGDAEIPDWFAEGLVKFLDSVPRGLLLSPAQTAARAGAGLTLAQMSAPPGASQSGLWQAQSYAMVAYMADRVGFGELLTFARDLGDQSFAAAYQSLMDAPLESIVPAWQRWILTTRAAEVYALTLYSPPTATPTALPTASPTLTPSVTPSPSPTITETPTGVLSPTPFNTATPTPTRTPAPPTVTPRPPVSAQPTPEGVVDGQLEAGLTTDTQLVLVIGLLGLIAILIIAFVRAGRK